MAMVVEARRKEEVLVKTYAMVHTWAHDEAAISFHVIFNKARWEP